MEKLKKHTTGAMPPPGSEWQAGRTAATIENVHEIEHVLENGSEEEKTDLLQKLSQMLQAGTLISSAPLRPNTPKASINW